MQVVRFALGAGRLRRIRLRAFRARRIVIIGLRQRAQAHPAGFRCAHAQPFHFLGRHFAEFARLETFHTEAADVGAHQAHDRIAERSSHAANLALLALDHDHAQDALITRAMHDFHEAGRGAAVFAQPDPALPGVKCLFVGKPGDGDAILLGMALAGMGELLGERAVVGQYDQPFTVGIEAAYREQVAQIGHQIEHCAAIVAGVWFARAQYVLRLVQREIDKPLRFNAQALAVHLDDVFFGVCLVAKFGDLAVDANAALFNQGFCAPPGGHVGLGHQLLNAYFHWGFRFLRIMSCLHYTGRRPELGSLK